MESAQHFCPACKTVVPGRQLFCGGICEDRAKATWLSEDIPRFEKARRETTQKQLQHSAVVEQALINHYLSLVETVRGLQKLSLLQLSTEAVDETKARIIDQVRAKFLHDFGAEPPWYTPPPKPKVESLRNFDPMQGFTPEC